MDELERDAQRRRRLAQRRGHPPLAQHGTRAAPSFSSAARAPWTSVFAPSQALPRRNSVLTLRPGSTRDLNGLVTASPRYPSREAASAATSASSDSSMRSNGWAWTRGEREPAMRCADDAQPALGPQRPGAVLAQHVSQQPLPSADALASSSARYSRPFHRQHRPRRQRQRPVASTVPCSLRPSRSRAAARTTAPRRPAPRAARRAFHHHLGAQPPPSAPGVAHHQRLGVERPGQRPGARGSAGVPSCRSSRCASARHARGAGRPRSATSSGSSSATFARSPG